MVVEAQFAGGPLRGFGAGTCVCFFVSCLCVRLSTPSTRSFALCLSVPIPLATRRAEGTSEKTPQKPTSKMVPVRVRDPDRVERVERLISIRPQRAQRAGAAVQQY